MAGPWFTVLRSGGEWQALETILLSNGSETERVRVEIKVELEKAN